MLLQIVLFLSGAVIMSVEILASRVLAVEFGDNLFVWGALIGTVIGALSLGYWLGGAAADKWPTRKGIAFVLCVSGVLIAVTVPFTRGITGAIYDMPMPENIEAWAKPVTAATALYVIPVMLLGAVSPYCIRLATDDLGGLGKKVGGLYAISSLGSIFGTFLTSFYLVGKFPVRATILAEGVSLIALAAVTFVAGVIVERRSGAAGRR